MRIVWLALLLGASLTLSACQSRTPPEPSPPPPPVFGDLQPVVLDAGVVEIARRYQDRFANDPENLLSASRLQSMAETYAMERFQPWGGPRTFKIVVRRAEINETGGGYSALMDVDLQMLDANRIVEGYDISSSTASIPVADSATVEEREARITELAEQLMRSLDVKIQQHMGDVFEDYVLTVQPAAQSQ
jgi:hypothetical protein